MRIRTIALTFLLAGIGALTVFHGDARADWVRGASYNYTWQASKFECIEGPFCFFYSGQVHTQDEMYNVASYYGQCPGCTPMLHDVRVTFRKIDNFTGANWAMNYDPFVDVIGSMKPYMSPSYPYLPPGYSMISCAFIGPPGTIPEYCFWGRPDWLISTGFFVKLSQSIAFSDGWTNTSGSATFQYGWW